MNVRGLLAAGSILLSSLIATPVAADTLFTDGFESATFRQWTQVDTQPAGWWQISTQRQLGKYSAHVVGPNGAGNQLRKALPTDTYQNVALAFAFKASSLDSKSNGEFDRFLVEVSTNGTSWSVLKEVNGDSGVELDGSWRQVNVPLPSHAGMQFRFRALLTDSGDRVWIDNVSVTGTPKESTLQRCRDSIDNDRDGLIDVADPECAAFYATLTVDKTGTGNGSVVSTPVGISCGIDCFHQYVKSTIVTLKSVIARGTVFLGWSGACSGTADCVVTMSSDKNVGASFTQLNSYTLSAVNDPQGGGSITSQPAGINCGADCTEKVYEGEVYKLTATPARGFAFTNWSGDCEGTLALCEITGSKDIQAIAHYAPLPAGMCGNAVVEWDEQCDDGNTTAGDGCSATCGIEPGFSCIGSPSQCFVNPILVCGAYGCF